jgi:hypothetical protein
MSISLDIHRLQKNTSKSDALCDVQYRFHSEELLDPRSTPNLEENLLSAVLNALFCIFAISI